MIRDASVYDIPMIKELGVLLHENFDKTTNLNEMLDDKYSKVIVYEMDQRIVGFLSATVLPDTCDIIDIVVDPAYRRKMIASNLIAYLIGELSEKTEVITLEVATKNTAAIRLYERFGFEVVNKRRGYYVDDDAYLMARVSE